MKALFGFLYAALFLCSFCSAQIQQPRGVPTTRIDTNSIVAYATAATNAGSLLCNVQDRDEYIELSNTSLSEGAVKALSAKFSGYGEALGLATTFTLPAPQDRALQMQIDMGSSHQGISRSEFPDFGFASITVDQLHSTENRVERPRVLRPDNFYTLTSILRVRAFGGDVKHLNECFLHAHMGDSFLQSEYLGNDVFYVTGSIENDAEVGNGGAERVPIVIEKLLQGGVAEVQIGAELVQTGDVIVVDCQETTHVGVGCDTTAMELGGNKPPPCEDSDTWIFKAHAFGFVTDER